MNQVLPIALGERSNGLELAVTALICADSEKLREMKNVVLLMMVMVFFWELCSSGVWDRRNGAHLALVGRGRDVAAAKYSAWDLGLRKPLDQLRPLLVTELLLSNDGDRILEGCITNFFVVCQRDKIEAKGKYMHDYDKVYSVEVQTAPITDGVLTWSYTATSY
ncbi:hypothetical protein REPUB_Repub13aG0063100 [Reevesia pubescens]